MAKDSPKPDDEWIDCDQYTVTMDSGGSFVMELNENSDQDGHVLAANAKPPLVKEILSVLFKVWPDQPFQFQVGARRRLTKIQVTPGKDDPKADAKDKGKEKKKDQDNDKG